MEGYSAMLKSEVELSINVTLYLKLLFSEYREY